MFFTVCLSNREKGFISFTTFGWIRILSNVWPREPSRGRGLLSLPVVGNFNNTDCPLAGSDLPGVIGKALWGLAYLRMPHRLEKMQCNFVFITTVFKVGNNPLPYLAWEIPWTEGLCLLQSMALKRVRHSLATNTFTFTLTFDNFIILATF